MNQIFKNTRYMWFKNPFSLTIRQLKELGGLKDLNLRAVRADNIKLTLQEFWKLEDPDTAEAFLKNGITGLLTGDFLLL